MANKEAVEFALTTLVAWLDEQGGNEIGGIVSRGGVEYRFELRRLEAEDEDEATDTE